jgi:hypothetical protein
VRSSRRSSSNTGVSKNLLRGSPQKGDFELTRFASERTNSSKETGLIPSFQTGFVPLC